MMTALVILLAFTWPLLAILVATFLTLPITMLGYAAVVVTTSGPLHVRHRLAMVMFDVHQGILEAFAKAVWTAFYARPKAGAL